MSIVRSVIAVLGGIAVLSIVLFAMEPIIGPKSDATIIQYLLWLACIAFSLIAGGFVTAWIAPRARVAHAMWMGALQAVMTFVAMLVPHEGVQQPLWVWLGGIALMVPAAWVGARIRSSKQRA
jgi:ABC-type polysaccharide/polyol phosphate export permease